MSKKSDMLNESQFVDLTDDELKEAIGAISSRIEDLRIEMKNDPDAEQMRVKLNAYLDDNFKSEIKEAKKRLKAARAVAEAKGIRWKMPQSK